MLTPQPHYNLVIIIPVYNDWESLEPLLEKIYYEINSVPKTLIVIINDGSSRAAKLTTNLQHSIYVEVVNLKRNLGHQKALAIGLSYVTLEKNFDKAIIMDADGEDKPSDIVQLLAKSSLYPDSIVFAQRVKRNEGLSFRMFYKFYKFLFKLLTGMSISFGNFCVIPISLSRKLIYVSEIWNHFPGGVIRSKLPYHLLPTERGKRFKGRSKMNFISLMLHGLSSFSVHIDTVSVRLLITNLSLLIFCVLAILVVTGIKFFSSLAIPGWTSNIVIGLTLLFLQALFFSVLLVFIILSYRTQKNFIPAIDYRVFIDDIQLVR